MTATGHALIGTVIAAKIGNPALAVPIALASHFLADAFPHWDTGYHRKQNGKRKFFIQSVIDVLAGFVLSYAVINIFFPSTNLLYAFFIILAAQAPDWLTVPYLFFDIKSAPFCWIYKLQKVFDRSMGMPWGVIDQIAIVGIVIALGRIF